MDAVSKIETDEVPRRATTRSLLSNLLSASFGQLVNSDKMSTDHLHSYIRARPPLGLAGVAIVEEKAELGFSGDGSVQGSFSYSQHWLDGDRAVSTFP